MPNSALPIGYDHRHRALRKRWEPRIRTGTVLCARCQKPILSDTPWDLGHTDDRRAYTGPEHAACNRSAGGRVLSSRRKRPAEQHPGSIGDTKR